MNAQSAYSAAMRLYPRQFREEYGADMVLAFTEMCEREPTWRVCARIAADLALTVPLQHLEVHMNRNATHLLVTLAGLVAVTGALLATIGGTSPAALGVGAALAIGGATIAIATWRRAAPASDPDPTSHWWKFTLAGPTLIGGVIIAAGMGVNAWFLGLAVVLLAILLFAAGVLLGAIHLAGALRNAS